MASSQSIKCETGSHNLIPTAHCGQIVLPCKLPITRRIVAILTQPSMECMLTQVLYIANANYQWHQHKDAFALIFYLFTIAFYALEWYCIFQACWTWNWVKIYWIMFHVLQNQMQRILNGLPRDISVVQLRDLICRVYQSMNDVTVCYLHFSQTKKSTPLSKQHMTKSINQ